MVSNTLDSPTLDAIGVLTRAVEQERVPGVMEFRLLANALRRAVDSRSEQELNEAARVFQTLDPEFRGRIVERAKTEAHAQASRAGAVTVTVDSPPLPGRPAPRAPRSAASSFLAALNGLRPSAKPDDSRNAAKDRLRMAVDSQRALPDRELPDKGADNGLDVGYDTGLRPGQPLPRSP